MIKTQPIEKQKNHSVLPRLFISKHGFTCPFLVPRLVLAVVLLGAVPIAAALNFNPATSHLLPDTSPVHTLVTDINSDGNLDIVFSMSGSGGGDASVRILVGNASGGFSDAQIATGFGPQATAAGDYDGDGFMDLAITSPSDASVYIYRGTGNTNFVQHQIISIPAADPDSIGVGDFDKDGILDIAIGTQLGTPFGVYFAHGNGNATFANPVGLPNSNQLAALDLTIADLNGDLNLDIATPTAVYMGAGDGTFTQSQALSSGQNIARGDLDNDGDQDLIIASATIIFTYLNDSNGNFNIQPIKNLAPSVIRDIDIADMDRDGFADLLLVDKNTNTVEFFPGLGNGALGGLISFAVGIDPTALAIGDWNKDDYLDFASANENSNAPDATVRLQIPPATVPGNIAPVATQIRLSIIEGGLLPVQLSATDAEQDTLSYTVVQLPTNGTLSGTAPNLSYQPNPGFTGTDSFTFKANDGQLDSNVASVDITVIPINNAPAATGQSVSTNEDVTVPVTLTATDADGNPLTYAIVVAPTNGGLSGTPPNLTYHPSTNFNGSDSFSFKANDGLVDSNTATVSITVNPVNDAPTAAPQSRVTLEDTPLSLVLSGSDVEGDALNYSIAVAPANGTLTGVAPNLNYIPNANFNGTDNFSFRVNDGSVDSNTATVSITVNPVNDAPAANAGPDQTAFVGDTIVLDASTSTDVDGDLLSYFWQPLIRPVGSTIVLSDITSISPTAVIDKPGTYSFRVYVIDGILFSSDDIFVTTQNSAPVANAGPDQTVQLGDLVALDGGLSSDVDGDTLSYAWTLLSQPIGSTATLTGAATLNPSFTADQPGSYTVELVVNDGVVNSLPDTVVISTSNIAPVADAGVDQSAFVGDTVTLDGSGSSDADGDPITFSWSLITIPMGSTAAIGNPSAIMPTFNPDTAGTYVAQLIVNDGVLNSLPNTVVVNVNTPNTPPSADAGPDQSVLVNDLVSLNGSGSSDVDGDPLSFSWSLITRPLGSTATLTGATAVNPSFVADAEGTFVAQLIVNDGQSDSPPASVMINVGPGNTAPVANAGLDQSVLVGDLVALNGTGSSDANGDPLSYNWSLTVPVGSTAVLSGANTDSPTFTPDVAGSYLAQLIVNDGQVNSPADNVLINANTPNTVPVADAGLDQSVLTGDLVTLDGSGSSDADNNPLTFNWSIISAPVGSIASLSNTAISAPDLTPDLAGTYVIQLIVNDGQANSLADTVTITVTDIVSGGPVTIVSADWNGSTLTVIGTGTPGATVSISGADTGEIIGTAVTVATDGSWSVATSSLVNDVPCTVTAASGVDFAQLAVTGATGVCAINFSKAEWDNGDAKLLIKGSGAANGVQHILQYSSTGAQISTFNGQGGNFEIEIELTSVPCSIRISEASGSAFIDQPIANAPGSCL